MNRLVHTIICLCVLLLLDSCGRTTGADEVLLAPTTTIVASTRTVVQSSPQQEIAVTNISPPTPEEELPSASPTVPPQSTTPVPATPTAPRAQASPLRLAATQVSAQTATPNLVAPTSSQAVPPRDSQLDAMVRGARADLAQRQGVALDVVEVVEVRSVTWPDPGLGCPQPGVVYKQVPVDGLLIQLRVRGQIFNYHSGGRKPPFLCQQPQQPAPTIGSGGENQ